MAHVTPDAGNAPLGSENLLAWTDGPAGFGVEQGAGRGQGWQLRPKWNFPSPLSWDEWRREEGCVLGCSSQHEAVPRCHSLCWRAPWGQHLQGSTEGPGWAPPLPQRAHAAFLGPASTATVTFHYKSPSPVPSARLHEELRRQRCEPALVHHTQRCPHAAATCSGHLGNPLELLPGGILPVPTPRFSQSHCPLSSGTLDFLSPGTQKAGTACAAGDSPAGQGSPFKTKEFGNAVGSGQHPTTGGTTLTCLQPGGLRCLKCRQRAFVPAR